MAIDFVEVRIMLAALHGDEEGVRSRIAGMAPYEIDGLDSALDLISTEIGKARVHRHDRKEFARD
jgi:hypothetical protein